MGTWKILKPKVENFGQKAVMGTAMPIVGKPIFQRKLTKPKTITSMDVDWMQQYSPEPLRIDATKARYSEKEE